MIGTTAGYKIRMNWCTFHAYIDLGETDDTTFELALSQISKADNALYSCPPKGWYIKEDVPGDFAIFRSPEMDELDKHMKKMRDKGPSQNQLRPTRMVLPKTGPRLKDEFED
jgi:hypothetical protein